MRAAGFDELLCMDDWEAIDFSLCDDRGNSILHHQAAMLNTKVVEWIIPYFESVNIQNNDGEIPAIWLIYSDFLTDGYFASEAIKILRMLKKAGADLHIPDKDGKDFLYHLISRIQGEFRFTDRCILEKNFVRFIDLAKRIYYRRPINEVFVYKRSKQPIVS